MNVHLKWVLATLAVAGVAVGLTLRLAPKPEAKADDKPAPQPVAGTSDEAVHILVAYSQPLSSTLGPVKIGDQPALFDKGALRTSGGKRIEITAVGLSSQEIVERVMNGMLKAHVILPSSDTYLELADKEYTLRTGKPLLGEKVSFMQQPYVLAIRRPMAEALGWPKKELGWHEMAELARNGWKSAGHPEWGQPKILYPQDDFGDSSLQQLVSIAQAFAGSASKEVTSELFKDKKLVEIYKLLDTATDWHRVTLADLKWHDNHNVEPQCQMVFVPEHVVIDLNDRRARRQEPPAWVAVYPKGATIVENITGAVVKREWVSKEQEEASAIALKAMLAPEMQRQVMARGFRPVTKGIDLTAPFDKAWGVNPEGAANPARMPAAEVTIDCRETWKMVVTGQYNGGTETHFVAKPVAFDGPADPDAARKVAVTSSKSNRMTPLILCVRKTKPSSVSITRIVRERAVTGSGAIIDARGYVVTNAHVVGDSKEVKIRILNAPDKVLEGEVVAVDAAGDLALVRIQEAGQYVPMEFGDSEGVEVGEQAVAIGNPFGYTGTVTLGIVSALGRELEMPSGAKLRKLLQTDASINPGNSGGPLVNIDGELIGINVAIRDGAQNIGFAISSNRVHEVAAKLLPK